MIKKIKLDLIVVSAHSWNVLKHTIEREISRFQNFPYLLRGIKRGQLLNCLKLPYKLPAAAASSVLTIYDDKYLN